MKIQFGFREAYPGAGYKQWRMLRDPGYLPDPCCDKMSEAYNAGAIKFGGRTLTERKECSLAIWYWECWPEGASMTRFPISFCPFCGEKIELKEVAEENAG